MVWLRDGKKFDDTCNRFDKIPVCDGQTDRRTDIQTSCDGTVRIMHTRRAVKITIIQQRLTKRRSTVLIRDVV